MRTDEFAPEGTIVPEKKEFEFLKERKFRIKAIKLRGEYSYGLLIPNKALRI